MTSDFGGNLGKIMENIEIDLRELEKPPTIPPLLHFETLIQNIDQNKTEKEPDLTKVVK